MRRKGFTLIELLAVIVILAIIALIATPIVLNIINDTRESAKIRSAELYIDALEQAIMRKKMNQNIGFNPSSCTIEDSEITCDREPIQVDVDGTTPTNGSITLINGKVESYSLVIDGKEIVNGNIEQTDSGALEAIQIAQNYIDAINSENIDLNLVFVLYDENVNTSGYDVEFDSSYYCEEECMVNCYDESDGEGGVVTTCDIRGVNPDGWGNVNIDGKLPDEGVFVIKDGTVVPHGAGDNDYGITYFKVGNYYVYYDSEGNLTTNTVTVPVCVAAKTLTNGVGTLVNKQEPFKEGTEYKCRYYYSAYQEELTFYVLNSNEDYVTLISDKGAEPAGASCEEGRSGPLYSDIVSLTGGDDLTDFPWLTLDEDYWLYKEENICDAYYVSTSEKKIVSGDAESISHPETKYLVTVRKEALIY